MTPLSPCWSNPRRNDQGLPLRLYFQLEQAEGSSLKVASAARWTLLGWLALAGAGAHEFTITPVAVVVTGDGTFQADVGLDADALALGLPLEADSELVAAGMRELPDEAFASAVERARGAVTEDLQIAFDGGRVAFQVSFPHHGTPAAAEAVPPTVLGTLARLTGRVPDGASEMVFQAPARYKTVSLQLLLPTQGEPYNVLLEPAQASPAIPLTGSGRTGSGQSVFLAYLKLGFTHIVPKGLDHILFVLGLFLLSARWRPLLYQVTAFTVAHSVTLALSMQGILALPERFVETLIALSISWVAVENIATSRLKPWRVALVFCFGLLHGLGFAGVLSELGLPEGRFLTALVSFNVGVELGQISVVALAFLVVGRFRHLAGYRRYVVIPSSAVIAAVGLWWSVTRALG